MKDFIARRGRPGTAYCLTLVCVLALVFPNAISAFPRTRPAAESGADFLPGHSSQSPGGKETPDTADVIMGPPLPEAANDLEAADDNEGPPAPSQDTPPADELPADGPAPRSEAGALRSTLERATALTLYPQHELSQTALQPIAPPTEDAESGAVVRHLGASARPKDRVRAVEAWAESGSMEGLGALMEALSDPAPEVRRHAAAGLKEFTPEDVTEALLTRLSEGPTGEAALICDALDQLPADFAPALRTTLNSEEPPALERQAAAFALGCMGVNEAVEDLAATIREAPPALSRAAADALYRFHADAEARVWLDLLEHPDAYVQTIAVRALGRAGGPEAYEALRKLARGGAEENSALQAVALEALSNWPAETVVPLLIEVMAANRRLAPLLAQELARLTQQDFGPFPELWLKWLDEQQPAAFPLVPAQ